MVLRENVEGVNDPADEDASFYRLSKRGGNTGEIELPHQSRPDIELTSPAVFELEARTCSETVDAKAGLKIANQQSGVYASFEVAGQWSTPRLFLRSAMPGVVSSWAFTMESLSESDPGAPGITVVPGILTAVRLELTAPEYKIDNEWVVCGLAINGHDLTPSNNESVVRLDADTGIIAANWSIPVAVEKSLMFTHAETMVAFEVSARSSPFFFRCAVLHYTYKA